MAAFMRRRVHPDKKAVRNPSGVFEIVRKFYDQDTNYYGHGFSFEFHPFG